MKRVGPNLSFMFSAEAKIKQVLREQQEVLNEECVSVKARNVIVDGLKLQALKLFSGQVRGVVGRSVATKQIKGDKSPKRDLFFSLTAIGVYACVLNSTEETIIHA